MRGPTQPPQRLKASFDEHMPSLHVLQHWNRSSADICVSAVANKGLGVTARRALRAGTAVARYEFRVVRRASAAPGDYRVEIGLHGRVGKPDARSFGPLAAQPGGVAKVGPLLNEPSASAGETANCVRAANEPFWGPPSHRRGAFVLRLTRDVLPGEELTWAYGETYGRRSYQ